MSQKIPPGGQSKNEKAKSEKGPISLENIEKHLRYSRTYLGAVFVKSFKKIILKIDKYSLIVYCNSHWFCVYCTKNTFEIFDPLGFLQKKKCIGKNFLNFLKSHIKGKTLYCNPKVQSDSSYNCGLFVVFFIRMRDMGHSFTDIMRKFSKKFRKNDKLVKLFAKKIDNV